jgi:hypothetical protein
VNKKFEAALELGFINDRINLAVNFYHNRCSNQLVGESIPGITGFTSFQNNQPATIQNQGWEFELSTTNFRNEALRWTTSFNLTIPTTKLISYPGIENSSYAYVYEVGKSLFMQKRFHYLNVDPVTGIYKFQDVDGDGNTTGDLDRQILVNNGINFYGGVSNNFSYKGFELSFSFQFTKQTRTNYLGGGVFAVAGSSQTNQPVFVMNRWQRPGNVTSIQKFTTGTSTEAGVAYRNAVSGYYTGLASDMTISDASFIRLQNTSLTWHIPRGFLKKTGLEEASLYAQGQNLFTITNFFGFDPESSFGMIPPLRTITVGAKISL